MSSDNSRTAGVPEEEIRRSQFGLFTILRIGRRRWSVIAGVPLLFLFITCAVLQVIPPTYRSGVELLVLDPQTRSVEPIGQRASLQTFDTTAINTEIAKIQSASVSLRVVTDLELADNPEFQRRNLIAALMDWVGASGTTWLVSSLQRIGDAINYNTSNLVAWLYDPSDSTETRLAVAAGILRDRIRVERLPLSYVLVISVTARHSQLAQRLAEKIVDTYLASEEEARQHTLKQLTLWLEDRLSDLRSYTDTADTQIATLKAESGVTNTGKGNIIDQQITDLNTQLIAARVELAEKQARLEQAQQLSSSKGSQQSGTTNATIGVVATHMLADLKNSYEIAARRAEVLKTSLERLMASRTNVTDQIKLAKLERSNNMYDKIVNNFESAYDEATSQATLPKNTVRIISAATVSSDPEFPRRNRFYLGGGILGIIVATLLIIGMEYPRLQFRTWAQAEDALGHPVLGTLPLLPMHRGAKKARTQRLVKAVIESPRSSFSEAVRTMRINLRLENGGDQKIIMVTSYRPGEGKSAIASLLAASCAAAGERTLLLDCDLRRRTISRDFGGQQPGLTEVLSGTHDITNVAFHNSTVGCHVVAAGALVDSPGDLLASHRMEMLFSQLREQYDRIVIDTPPLVSVIDALVLAKFADQILLAIDGSSTSHHGTMEGLDLLRRGARAVSGTVLNKVDPRQMQCYGYYDA